MLVHLCVPPSLVLYLPECHWAFRDDITRVRWNDFARILQSWLLPHKTREKSSLQVPMDYKFPLKESTRAHA